MADFDIKYKVSPDEADLKKGAKQVQDALKDVKIDVNVDKNDIKKTSKFIKEEFEDAGTKAGKGFGENFKSGFGSIGNIVAGLGIANLASGVLSSVKESAQASIELDKQVKNIGTLGVANFEEFAQRATELSKTVPDSAANIAGAVYDAVSAGISGTNEDIMNFVAVASKAAIAGMTDTGTAVNGLTSILNAYKRPVTDAAAVSNELFAGVKLGKITFEEFVAGVGEVVPVAAAANVGFDEISASIATITSQGVKAPQAFTKLNQALVELQKPGTQLSKVMSGVTVELNGVSQKLSASNITAVLQKQGLTKTLQDIEKSASNMGLSLTQVFSSVDAGSAALLLTGKNAQFASEMLAKTRKEIAEGAAEQAFNVANTSIENQISLLKNNLQAALQPIFANVLPIIAQLATQIAGIFQNPEIQKAFQTISAMITQLLQSVIPPLMNVLAPLISGLLQAISPLIQKFGELIAGVLPNLLKILEPLIELLPEIGEIFGDLQGAISPVVTTLLSSLSPVLADYIRTVLPPILELVKELVGIIKQLTPILTSIAKIVSSVLSVAFKVYAGVIKGVVGIVTDFIKALKDVAGFISDVADFIGGSGAAAAMSVYAESTNKAAEAQEKLNSKIVAGIEGLRQYAQLQEKQAKEAEAKARDTKQLQDAGLGSLTAIPGINISDAANKLRAAKIQIENEVETAASKGVAATEGQKKTNDEIIKQNRDLIAKYLIKTKLTEEESELLNNLILQTKALVKEQDIYNKALENATKFTSITEFKPVSSANINTGKSQTLDLVSNVRIKPQSIDISGITEQMKAQFDDVLPLFTELNERFSAIFKPNQETLKSLREQKKNYEQDAANLKKQLLNKEISLEEFQQRSEEIEQNRLDTTEKINEQLGNSFKKLADSIGASFDLIENYLQDKFVKSLQDAESEFATLQRDSRGGITNIVYDFTKLQEASQYAMGALGASIGEAIAQGKNVGDAFLTTLLDTVQKAILTYIPLIYLQFSSWLGPIAGPIAATAAIVVAQAGLSLAKSAIGADKGVIGINDRYSNPASVRDTIPIMVREGESILTPEFTEKHRDLLTHLYGGRTEESYFKNKYMNVNGNYSINPAGELIQTNRELMKAIKSGFEVKSTNINKIKIVDKTVNGIKEAKWR